MDDTKYMNLAIKEGLKGLSAGEVPIGAVLTLDDFVIAIGHNTKETMNDPSGHAEIQVIKSASKFLSRWRLTGCSAECRRADRGSIRSTAASARIPSSS